MKNRLSLRRCWLWKHGCISPAPLSPYLLEFIVLLVINVTPLIYYVRIVIQPIFHCKSITGSFFLLTCGGKITDLLAWKLFGCMALKYFFPLVTANKSRCLRFLFYILKLLIYFPSIFLRFSLSQWRTHTCFGVHHCQVSLKAQCPCR